MRRQVTGAAFLLLAAMGVLAAAGCTKPSSGEMGTKSVAAVEETALASAADEQTSDRQAANEPTGNETAQNEQQPDDAKQDDTKQADPKEDDAEKKQQEAAKQEYEQFAKPFFKDLKEKLSLAEQGDEVDFAPLVKQYSERLATKSDVSELRDAIAAAQALEIFSTAQNVKPIYESMEKLADRIQFKNPEVAGQVREYAKSGLARLNLVGTKPAIEGMAADGAKFDWSKYKDKVVLLDFWATWCGPCLQELPNVKQAYEKYHSKGFEVVGISLDNSKEDLVAFLDKEKLPWTTIYPAGELPTKFLVEGIPATFLVDREGKIASISARGPRLEAQLEKMLEKK